MTSNSEISTSTSGESGTKRHRRIVSTIFATCLCGRLATTDDSLESDLSKRSVEENLITAIQRCDLGVVERLMRRVRCPQNYTITVRRRHIKAHHYLVERSSDPFLYFNQECSPILWAVDCQQWKVIPVLTKAGLDPNRPQTCRRWTSFCSPGTRNTISAYKRFWSRGRYTYQSSLDYFFASIYEVLSDEEIAYSTLDTSFTLGPYFQQLPELLSSGVDVHRIDSVIVFNQLAASFDRYLSQFSNQENIVPDIPEKVDTYVVLNIVRTLIQNGFSQFECMEFLSPCHNWFGILLCLLCHPKIDSYPVTTCLPPIIRQAALLMINFLSMRCTFPTPNEFEDNLENLQLRKLYTKRYTERRLDFNKRLQSLRQQCLFQKTEPLSLKLLTRNHLRRQIGGIRFRARVAQLPLPQSLIHFLQFIEIDHLKSCAFPQILIDMAQGINVHACPASPTADKDDSPRENNSHLLESNA